MPNKIPYLVVFSSAYLFILSIVMLIMGIYSSIGVQKFNAENPLLNVPVIGVIVAVIELVMVFVPFFICIPSIIAGLGLLKRRKWSRTAAALIYIIGVIIRVSAR